MGTIQLSVREIQGHLRQLSETRRDLTPEERYSLARAVEVMDFLHTIAPGLHEAVKQHKENKD